MDAQNNQQQTPSSQVPGSGKNTGMAAISYLGPLVIVSYLVANKDPFVKFHIKQGFVLLVIEVAMWILGAILWILWPILWLINVFVLVLVIVGIVRAVKGEEKELPLVGRYASYFKI